MWKASFLGTDFGANVHWFRQLIALAIDDFEDDIPFNSLIVFQRSKHFVFKQIPSIHHFMARCESCLAIVGRYSGHMRYVPQFKLNGSWYIGHMTNVICLTDMNLCELSELGPHWLCARRPFESAISRDWLWRYYPLIQELYSASEQVEVQVASGKNSEFERFRV